MCAMVLLAYHSVITYYLGNGEGDVLYAEEILQPHLKAFPKVSYYIYIYLFTTTEWLKRTRKCSNNRLALAYIVPFSYSWYM